MTWNERRPRLRRAVVSRTGRDHPHPVFAVTSLIGGYRHRPGLAFTGAQASAQKVKFENYGLPA